VGIHNRSTKFLNKSFWKNFTFKLNKIYGHKLYVLLSNFGLVPKIQIRFTSYSGNIDLINKSFVKKILFKLKLFYVKELVLINNRSFDIFKKNKVEISEQKIVLMDHLPLDDADSHFYTEDTPVKHYYYLNKLINSLSNMYNKEAVVCLHPDDNLELKKKYFPNLEVVQYRTPENVYKAFLVLFFDSSSIVEAIFHKKRILTLFSNYSGVNVRNHGLKWVKQAGLLSINIEDEIKINKNKLLSKLDDAKKNYSNYIKTFLAPDGNNRGCEKIIKTLKERFF
jgi:hypothetical protein